MTKRKLLSIIAGLYDPLGWLSAVTIKGKILFQKLWESRLQWDDELPPLIRESVTRFVYNLDRIKQIKIPRQVILPESRHSFHLFTDASEKA